MDDTPPDTIDFPLLANERWRSRFADALRGIGFDRPEEPVTDFDFRSEKLYRGPREAAWIEEITSALRRLAR